MNNINISWCSSSINKCLFLFQTKLLDFKLDADISTLLLPLNVACNGLNIVEATHVLLVEPILNPATELQAIGRVHRIGQTRSEMGSL